MENWKIVFQWVPENKKEQAEEAKQEESIKYLRWFLGSVIAQFPVGFIPVVKRQQGLDDACHPEKSH